MTKEQFIDNYKGKAVWCKTEELAKEFLKVADSFGFKWFGGDKPTTYSHFNTYKDETCYLLDINFFMVSYLSLSCAKNNGYKIIEYKPEEELAVPQNLIPFIAEKLGVEIGEEFKIVENPQGNTYKLEYDGLKAKFSYFDYSYSANLDKLIIGKYTIQKLPQKPILTEDEKVILRNLPKQYEYIARDYCDSLYVYEEVPIKRGLIWRCHSLNKSLRKLSPFSHLFQFIKWEDKEPHNIQELLDEYENFKEQK